ncbi:hypothetical protein GH733_012282 [Mirounga leonina]|nr:hypothetical protein GH733_012282 [Mirounga leonina]
MAEGVILDYSSVPVFESYIIQDPKAFYVWAGIVLNHHFNDSKQPLPLEVRTALLEQRDGAAQARGESMRESCHLSCPSVVLCYCPVLLPEEVSKRSGLHLLQPGPGGPFRFSDSL